MPIVRTILKSMTFLAGVVLAFAGTGILAAVGSGDVRGGVQGATFMGVGFLVVAAPCIAYPFSPRLAYAFFSLALAGFAISMLCLAFGTDMAPAQTRLFQVAASCFSAILALRFWLAHRRHRHVGGA